MLQAKFKASIITTLYFKAYKKKLLNRITGECGCNVTAKLEISGDWFKQPKKSTKEVFKVDCRHVAFSDGIRYWLH